MSATHRTRFDRRICQVATGMIFAAAIIFASRAQAEILDSAPNGFSLRESAHIVASPDKVYAALTTPQRWWSSLHTFSGNAANMSFEPRAGGCWCETLPNGGSVLHMTVVFVDPNKTLRMRGAMGPFQAMATETVLTWTLTPAKDGTHVVLTSSTGGYLSGGLVSLSKVVDRVFAEQTARLKLFVETGSPESGKP